MLDIIAIILLISGICIFKTKSTGQKKIYRNVGLTLIVLSLIYIMPNMLSGVYNGFINTVETLPR